MKTEQQNILGTAVAPAATSPTDQKEASTKRRTLAEKLAALEASKARLAKRAAALTKEARHERNGQLIVWGIMSELTYQKGDAATRQRMKTAAASLLKGRDLDRALAGFARLDGEMIENGNTSPPVPH